MLLGMFVLKAIPLHLGHIHAINIAATQCEHLYIVLCHSEHDNEYFNNMRLKPIHYKQRYKWLLEIYQDIPHIHIITHFENEIPDYPNGWKEWSNSIKELFKKYGKFPAKWFSSEICDKTNAEKFFAATEFVLIDPERKEIPISGTKIRRDGIYKYWKFLPGVVRPFFAKKVVLIGTESTGKSTLTKFLAKKFNTSWAEEYGREYVEKKCFGQEDLLTIDDYAKIAQKHKICEEKALRSANKVTFIDTEAIVTQFYCLLYEHKLNAIVDAIAKSQKYDLWLFLKPDVTWVKDNIRQHERNRYVQATNLLHLCHNYGLKKDDIKFLTGTYYNRMTTAITYVNELLSNEA